MEVVASVEEGEKIPRDFSTFAVIPVDLNSEAIGRESLPLSRRTHMPHREMNLLVSAELFADDTVVLSVSHGETVIASSPRVSVEIPGSPYMVDGVAKEENGDRLVEVGRDE